MRQNTRPLYEPSFAPPEPRVNWWLRLTSSGWDTPQITLAERETTRRSGLVSWLTLGLFGVLLIISPIAIDDLRSLMTFAIAALGLVIAAALNRFGYVRLAGVLLVALISGAVFGATLASPIGLTMGQLPNYDALAVSVVVAATVLPRGWAFVVALLDSAGIVADYLLQPHNHNIDVDALLYSSVTLQTVSLLVRPIAIQFIMALISYLWVRGVERAIRRADRAEEMAFLQQREIESTRELDEGVRQLLDAHVRLANGDFHAQVPQLRSAALWQIGVSLNNLIGRLSRLAQADVVLRRTEETAAQLAVAVRTWHSGRGMAVPPLSHTPLDPVLTALQDSMGGQPASAPRSSASRVSSRPMQSPPNMSSSMSSSSVWPPQSGPFDH